MNYVFGTRSIQLKIPKTLHIILRAWLDDKSNCILDFAQLEIIPIMQNQEKNCSTKEYHLGKIWYVYFERWLHIYSINRIQYSSQTKHFHVILLHIAFLVQNLKLWQPFCPCVFPLVEDGLSACVEFFSYSRFDGRECIENKFLSLSKFCGCFYSIHL